MGAGGLMGCGDDDGGDGTPDSGRVDGGNDPVDGGGDENDGGNTPECGEQGETTVSGDISTNTTWTCANEYRLTAPVFVTNNAVLTIEPGTRILGDDGSHLVITRGARLVADGTAEAPIVFTSSRAEGSRGRGDWGGVVLLGRAPINVEGGEDNIEGLPATEERGVYGGTDAAHNCGTLRYVRVEYAGDVIGEDNELNGLTLGACGTGTVVDYVQVHNGLDDAFEMFGGTVNLRHVVASSMDDDGLDWDQGYTGSVQFAIIQRGNSSSADPNGIEADNLRASPAAAPISEPTVYNLTVVGANNAAVTNSVGMVLRRGTHGHIFNAIVVGFGEAGVEIPATVDPDGDGPLPAIPDPSAAAAASGDLEVENSIFFNNGVAFSSGAAQTAFSMAGAMNQTETNPMLSMPYNLTAPNFAPAAALTSGAATPAGTGIDATATFIGAIRDAASDWTQGWTAYPAE
ncbi:Hypothetical protein DB32_002037 [Sandaracinus amylolyticus]|uniref:Lipoprotein n=2 Tax=Sandaracinus amylolyticus TaxID=927083 RepID=A0A0F6YHB8_9BACT|nr:Hypothetical protein DB32_002037 [Sandaracinus amylolyticus]